MSECTERRHNAQNSVAQEIEYILKSVEYANKFGDTFQQVGTVIAAKIALENIMKDWEGQEMKMCEEMIKLRKELDMLGIKWRDESEIMEVNYRDYTMYRTKFDTYNRDTQKSYGWSVIFGYGSYGQEKKKLECMSDYYDTDDGVIGYQTADEIIKAVKESIGLKGAKTMKVHELLSILEAPPEYAWVTPSFQLYLDDKSIYDSEGKDLKEYYQAKAKYANYEVKWATIAVDYCDYGCLIIHMK